MTISGTVTDGDGAPVPDAMLELWQAEPTGRSATDAAVRPVGTDGDERWSVTTVKPGATPGQAPHIAVDVFARGLLRHLVTRIYFPDEAEANAADRCWPRSNAERRATLVAKPDGEGLRFDVRLQGEGETVFFDVAAPSARHQGPRAYAWRTGARPIHSVARSMAAARTSPDAATRLPFYVRCLLGPFGGNVVAVIIPQLRDAFDATAGAVAASIPVYLIPFAVLQLVSGTLGERWGRRRVVRTAYVVYAITSAAATVAPGIGAFLVTRAAAGCTNAFLTPLLLADRRPRRPARARPERAGVFASVQVAAVAMAPLCGGLLGAIDWRLVFIVPPSSPSRSPPCPRVAGRARTRADRRACGRSSPVGSVCCAPRPSPPRRA